MLTESEQTVPDRATCIEDAAEILAEALKRLDTANPRPVEPGAA